MDRTKIRTDLFVSIYSMLKRVLPEIYRDTQFDGDHEKYLILLYFKMSDRYKELRLKSPDHRTNDTKKAGLTIAAIMAMRPIIPATKNAREKSVELKQFYANPIFALACATAIMRKPLYTGVESEKIQFYGWLDTLRWPSTAPFLSDAEAQSMPDASEPIALSHSEISQIDMIVLKLVDALRCIDLEQQIFDLSDDEEA